jgi:hypothetical protein
VALGDRRLQAVRAQAAAGLPGPGQGRPAAADRGLVPAGAVLLLEQDRLAVGAEAGREAGGGELEQREQPVRLRLIRGEPGQHPGQPLGLGREVEADQVGA